MNRAVVAEKIAAFAAGPAILGGTVTACDLATSGHIVAPISATLSAIARPVLIAMFFVWRRERKR